MQLDRTARLVKRLKTYCEENKILQKTLASQLQLSPQGIFEIFKGNNSPSAETALQIIEIIEPEFMSIIVDPPKPPRQAAGTNPNFPRNLEEARSRIAFLNQEIAQLKGAAAPLPVKLGATAPTPTAKAQTADPGADAPPTDRPNKTPMPASPPPPKLTLSPDLDSPVKIQKVLDQMNVDDLRLALNSEKDKLRIALLYREIQKRRDLVNL